MFDPTGVREFRYLGHDLDPGTGTVRLGYELAGPDLRLAFTEVVELPVPARLPGRDRLAVLDRVLDLLLVVAGTSYYKIAAPPVVTTAGVRLHPAAGGFVRDLYTLGLGEFAYRNDLPHVLDLDPDVTGPEVATPEVAAAPGGGDRPLVPVGGGKDSVVSVEALRAGGYHPVLFRVTPNQLITDTFAAAGLPALVARRRLDPAVFALNADGGYNGHIPVTAINSLIAVATAVLHGLGPVVMSNERSAAEPNTVWHGYEVNHQWSKSLTAERGLAAALAAHAGLPGGCFSLLRPFSELHIAAMFAGIDRYDHVVTSCNRAYLISGATARWCGDCPKCRFVFLILAPFVARDRLVGIVGRDMLADPAQLPGYLELLGIDAHKPFECVGEVAESLVAVQLLAERGGWAGSPVLAGLAAAVPAGGWPDPAARAALFTASAQHLVPPGYRATVPPQWTVLDAAG